jgi:hypothetical protein
MRAAQTPRQMHYAMGIHNMEIDYGLLPDVADSETVLSLAEMTPILILIQEKTGMI